jgi:hypothetical protein
MSLLKAHKDRRFLPKEGGAQVSRAPNGYATVRRTSRVFNKYNFSTEMISVWIFTIMEKDHYFFSASSAL